LEISPRAVYKALFRPYLRGRIWTWIYLNYSASKRSANCRPNPSGAVNSPIAGNAGTRIIIPKGGKPSALCARFLIGKNRAITPDSRRSGRTFATVSSYYLRQCPAVGRILPCWDSGVAFSKGRHLCRYGRTPRADCGGTSFNTWASVTANTGFRTRKRLAGKWKSTERDWRFTLSRFLHHRRLRALWT